VLDAVVKPLGVAAAGSRIRPKREQLAETESLDEAPVAAARIRLEAHSFRQNRMYARAPEETIILEGTQVQS